MKRQILKQVSAFGLAVSILFSCLVIPSLAAETGTISAVLAARKVAEESGQFANDVLDSFASWFRFNFNLVNSHPVSVYELEQEIGRYNNSSWMAQCLSTSSGVPDAVVQFFQRLFENNGKVLPSQMRAYAKPDPAQNNIYRPFIDGYGWLVDSAGVYPYCSKEEYEAVYPPAGSSGTPAPSAPQPFDGRWLTTNSIRDSKKTVQKSFADMDATRAELGNKYPNSYIKISSLNVGGLECMVIRRLEEGPGNRDWVWCDPNGLPFVYVDPSTQGSSQDWNYDKIQDITNNQTQEITNIVNEQGDKIDKLIEINNETSEMKVNVPVQVGPNEWSLLTLNADQITIDRSEDNRTIYQIDSHDVTYNVENNYYEYNYYTYNFEYTYNNTYVTYIGSTAEYQPKEWALYYELPDGRSSADLTEEDIAGLSFQFQDMVNYKRSATDTSLRALYHFDGNVEDSSYWSTQGAFTWDKGASITYMESNAFNGAMYLDEKEHQFTITLPSNIGSQDFSIQWRYYQNSATTTDHNENYVTVGGQKLLGWSEQSLYSLGTTKLSTGLSVGTWQELALVRNGTTVYMYHNGVKIGSATVPTVFDNKIVFYFGANSRAYSMMDELRVTNFAIASKGAAYTPSAVPFDTNSVLVLPGGAHPVADEYWSWDTTITPTLKWDFTNSTVSVYDKTSKNGGYVFPSISTYAVYRKETSYFSSYDGFSRVSVQYKAPSDSYGELYYSYSTASVPVFNSSRMQNLFLPISLCNKDRNPYKTGTYTISVMLLDGSIYSSTVSLTSGVGKSFAVDLGPLTGCIRNGYGEDDADYVFLQYLSLGLKSGYSSADIVYMELVPGTKANTGHEFVSCIYDSTELQPNTAAIQTMIPVKGYTVGGVRPTFPERGDVWMPVEGSRISGVYIYNGQAWEETNARYWTGKRWIPIYAFDLVTLADMWDVGSSSGGEVTPPISSEYSFWNWWKEQWLDFREWLADNLGGGGSSIIFPSPSECEHTYAEKVLTSPTCTQKGTALYFCTKCGDSYTDIIDASGHDWVMKDSLPDVLDEAGEVEAPGYDLYRCSICGEEYKDYARTGPPGAESGFTLSELIQQLFGALGNLVGSLVDWVLELGKEAMDGFGSLGDYFKEKAEEVQGFGGEYVGFLGGFFEIIPPEIKTCISLALLLFGLSLFIRKVIL